jgi:sugar-specific transcriptional regulator TrmB
MGQSDMTGRLDPRRFAVPEARRLFARILTNSDGIAPSPELRQLLELGLITPDARRPDRYIALDPREAIARLRTDYRAEARELLAAADELPSQYQELIRAYQAAHPATAGATAVEYVVGIDAIEDRQTSLLAACRKSLITCQPHGPRRPELLALSYRRDLEILARGATMHTLYRSTVRRDEATANWARTMTGQGAEIRTLVEGFQQAVIIDQHIAVLQVLTPWEGDEPAPARALFVFDEGLVRFITAGFWRDWARARPWAGEITRDIDLDDEQGAILRQLAAGLDVGEIADGLQVTDRTIRMRVAEMRALADVPTTPALLYWWAKRDEPRQSDEAVIRAT